MGDRMLTPDDAQMSAQRRPTGAVVPRIVDPSEVMATRQAFMDHVGQKFDNILGTLRLTPQGREYANLIRDQVIQAATRAAFARNVEYHQPVNLNGEMGDGSTVNLMTRQAATRFVAAMNREFAHEGFNLQFQYNTADNQIIASNRISAANQNMRF